MPSANVPALMKICTIDFDGDACAMTIDFDGEASTIGVEGEASMNSKSE